MSQTGTKKGAVSKINKNVAINSLIVFVVLLLAWVAGFASRLFAVIRFESIIHEFDPWQVFLKIPFTFLYFYCVLIS